MVVKKKRTYKKQKGGLVLPQEIPEKLTEYFDFIIFKIQYYIINIEANSNSYDNNIKNIIEEIKNLCNVSYNNNIYILKLSVELLKILFGYFNGISYKITLKTFVKTILSDIFHKQHIYDFEKKLIIIFINMLFNHYILINKDKIPVNIKSIRSLLSTFHLDFRDNEYLMN
jgi:hypothetical protein